MAGNSRLAYHAVPRILSPNDEQTLPLCLEPYIDSANLKKSSEKLEETVVISSEGPKNIQFCPEEIEICCKRTKYQSEESSSECVEGASGNSLEETTEIRLLREYLAISRININIRQVLAPGQTFPS